MTEDTRPLHERVRALARQYEAMAIGAEKRPGGSVQDAPNARCTAAMLFDAASFLATMAVTQCFECSTELVGPFCPACNPGDLGYLKISPFDNLYKLHHT